MREMKDSGVAWIGKIPAQWGVVYLSSIVSERKHKNEGMKENNLLSLSYGNVVRKNINTSDGLLPANFEGYNIIELGDIVLRLTDLQNDHTSLRTGLCKEKGIITSAYVTLNVDNGIFSSEYLHYLLHSFDCCKGFYGMGSGVRQGLNYDGIKKIEILMPDKTTQQKIAAHLDRKCTQIDALISNAQQQIEKLKAYKQSVITETVTKGLDPDVAMKDSGVDWIGEIPEHWDTITLSSLSKGMRNGYVGPTKKLFFETGIKYIQSLHIKEGEIDFLKHEYYVSEEWANQHPKIHTGNLLIVQTGDIGQVAVVTDEYDNCNCHALIIVEVNNTVILSEYLSFYLQSKVGKELLLATKTGALLPHLNSGRIGSTMVCVPPIQEQGHIIEALNNKTALINDLINLKQQKIEKLQQYKKSLIYEYVTGKKEV